MELINQLMVTIPMAGRWKIPHKRASIHETNIETKWEIFQQTIFDDQTLQEAMLLNPQI